GRSVARTRRGYCGTSLHCRERPHHSGTKPGPAARHAAGVGNGGGGRGHRMPHSIRAASSNDSRGDRGYSTEASPRPRLTRILERTEVPAKKAASTLSLSKPDIGPVSSPSERAARIR